MDNPWVPSVTEENEKITKTIYNWADYYNPEKLINYEVKNHFESHVEADD